MRLVSLLTLVASFILCNTPIHCQTIARNNLDYFVGCFEIRDTVNRSDLDLSHFENWRLIRTGHGPTETLNSLKRDFRYLWLYDWIPLSEQGGQVKWSTRWQYYDSSKMNYLFYIMQDYFGHEVQRNVLTVWQPLGCDSIRYYCGQSEGFQTFIGSARVKVVTIFPDSSLLLIAEVGGEGYGGMSFFRGVTPCHFENFYHNDWTFNWENTRGGKFTDITFRFPMLDMEPSYRIEEILDYKTVIPDSAHPIGINFIVTIDSTKAHSIDLWELARQYFKIE